MSSSDSLIKNMFYDIFDAAVLKYSVYSIIAASIFIAIIGHFALELGMHSLLDVLHLSVENYIPDSIKEWVGFGVGGLSFILSFFLFSFMMPFLTTFIFPLAVLFQLIFAKNFSQAFQKKHYSNNYKKPTGVVMGILILIKWTIIKLILSIMLIPILHMPVVGMALSIFIITLWGTLIYFEIVARSYFKGLSYWKVLSRKFFNLCFIAFLAILSNYLLIWLLGSIGAILPVAKITLLIMMASVIIGNYVLMAEFIRDFNDDHI